MTTTTTAPGPKGAALGRTLLAYALDPFGALMDLARDYGDVVGFGAGPVRLFLINRPQYIEDVLVTHDHLFVPMRPYSVNRAMRQGLFTSHGDLHGRQRRMLAPMYDRERTAAHGDAVVRWGGWLAQRWQEGAVIDIEREMVRIVVAASAETLFGDDARSHMQGLVFPAFTVNEYLGTRDTNPLSAAAEVVPLLPANRRFWQAMRRLDRELHALIQARRAEGADRGDLLSTLLQARSADDGEGMSDAQVRDEVIANYTTGNAVTSSGLLWTWYLLSEHPAVEQRFHAEIDSVLAGRAPRAADLERLPYTRMVIAESLRLYPPAWTIGRRAVQEHEIGGYVLPAGSVVLLSPYVTQHDPRYFPDPFTFDPQRWTPEAAASRPTFAYFPFSGGPRGCLGEHLALIMIGLLLVALAQRWQPRLVHDRALGLRPLIALRPRGGMRMRLERRSAG